MLLILIFLNRIQARVSSNGRWFASPCAHTSEGFLKMYQLIVHVHGIATPQYINILNNFHLRMLITIYYFILY